MFSRSLAVLTVVTVSVSVPVRCADQTLSNEELLRRTDIGALAPDSFRSHMRLTAGDKPPLEVEVWRKGEARTLVRLLGPKERGKYLLRLGPVLWFLAPGAKKPVRLSPSYRLRGSATIDDVLGLQYARDYKVESAAELEGGLVALDLTARGPGAIYPAVRYVVRRSTLPRDACLLRPATARMQPIHHSMRAANLATASLPSISRMES